MMTIDEAIKTLNSTAWLCQAERLDKITEAVAIAEWCMKAARKEYEHGGFTEKL